MLAFRHILVPIDFGEPSKRALDLAVEIAQKFDAKLTLLHTWEIPSYAYAGMAYSAVELLTPIEEAARTALEASLADVKKRYPNTTAFLRKGVAWQEILQVVERDGVDLVVMGTHGRRGLTHALLGSVAEKVVRMSPVPVLSVRGPKG